MKSMTGFGRFEIVNEDARIQVEMKAVNHRYLDLGIKMPRRFNVYESAIRSMIKDLGVERGKIDLFITVDDYRERQGTLRYNAALAGEYVDSIRQMSKDFGLENDLRAVSLARFPEVFTIDTPEDDEEELWNMTKEAITGAVKNFIKTREEEGAHLFSDLNEKLDGMLLLVDEIEKRSPEIVEEYRKKIEAKVSEFLADTSVDDSLIASEVTIYADKVCTDEETVRLRSHIEAMKQTMTMEGGIGRKLDFLAQEMNREANTILSKANDLAVSDLGISLKTEVEKVREQVQNVE